MSFPPPCVMEDNGAARGGAANRTAHGGAEKRNTQNNHRGSGGGGGGRNGRGGYHHTASFRVSDPSMGIFDIVAEGSDNGLYARTVDSIIIHVGKSFPKYTAEFKTAIKQMRLVIPNKPTVPTTESPIAVLQYEDDLRDWRDRSEAYSGFAAWLSSVIMGQSTEAIASKIKSSADFAAAENDGILLLKIVSRIMNNYEEYQNMTEALHDIVANFYLLKKGQNETMASYHERFKSHSDVMLQNGCAEVYSASLNKYAADPKNPTDADRTAAFERVKAI